MMASHFVAPSDARKMTVPGATPRDVAPLMVLPPAALIWVVAVPVFSKMATCPTFAPWLLASGRVTTCAVLPLKTTTVEPFWSWAVAETGTTGDLMVSSSLVSVSAVFETESWIRLRSVLSGT
jgi:hypothetical protein